MKVVIGTDSLHRPMAGVGRYTYELCKRLVHSPAISELEGFDFGRFHSVEERLKKLDEDNTSENGNGFESTVAKLRLSLSRSLIATSIYQQYATVVCGLILKQKSDTIFHSPNFHLPKFTRKSVVTIHDLSYLLFPEYHPGARVAWMTKLVPKAVEDSSHIICVSESTKAALIENYQVDPQKVSVTYLGVDDKFHVRGAEIVSPIIDSYGLSFGQYLLCVSTIEPRKNIEGLVKAFMRLSKATRLQHPLVLIGGFGWHYQQLQQSLEGLVNEGVMHLGFVPQDDLPYLYSGARCFVYPSFYEGFGLPVLEAQASGIPVIASDTSSVPEVASEDALMIDPYDGGELFQAMNRAIEDDNWLESCSVAGLQKARDFTWNKCAEATIQVYEKLNLSPVDTRERSDSDCDKGSINDPYSFATYEPIVDMKNEKKILGATEPIAPQVTVAVPSFNQGQFLDETLSSIFQQDLPVEVFVLDGGSTDNSLDIISKWESKLAGWRSHSDLGQATAINEGIAQGSAPFVCWLNSDDYFYAGKLNKLVHTLKGQPEKQFAYANCWAVLKSGQKLTPYLTLPFSPRLFANFCFIAQPATLIRRAAWEQTSGLNEDMQLAFDYDLWWRLYKEYGKPAFCRNFVAATRMHKNSKTANFTELHYQESIDVVKHNWGSVPFKWHLTLPVMKMIHEFNK